MRARIIQSEDNNDAIQPQKSVIDSLICVRQPKADNVCTGIEQMSAENLYMAQPKQPEIQNMDASDVENTHLEMKCSQSTINSTQPLGKTSPTTTNSHASEAEYHDTSSDQLINEIKDKTDIYDQVNSILYSTQLFEAFMENTPQTVLQLYILACNGFVASSWLQWWSVGSSLASVSWITVNHYCSLHPNEDIKFINVKLGILLPRYLFLIASRVLAMALFASVYHWWLFVIAGGHTIIVFLYIVFVLSDITLGTSTRQTYECLGRCFLVSITTLFCFNPRAIHVHTTYDSHQHQRIIKTKERTTRNHYVFYYTVSIVINVLLTLLWCIESPSPTVGHTGYSNIPTDLTDCNCTHVGIIPDEDTRMIYHLSMMITIIITWALSVGFTCLYYAWYHHSVDTPRRFNNRGKDNLLREIENVLENNKFASWQTFEEAPDSLTLKMTFLPPEQHEGNNNKLRRIRNFITSKLHSPICGNEGELKKDSKQILQRIG